MKRLLLSAVALVMAMGMSAQRWDFTNWSAETVANLKAANALGTEWSDIEKAGGTTADIAKENCFWEVKAHGSAEGAPLTIGGTPVKELEGLLFLHTNDRSLAIAVNYGDCTPLNGSGFGPYNGPQYLWFGGKNLNYIVIPNVKPGTEIKIGVESHKVSDARGLKLYVGRGNTGTELKDKEGNTVEYPKTYQDQSWYLPTDLTDTPNEDGTYDITLRNNNGCHLYYIQVGDGTGEGPSYNAGYLYSGATAMEELPLYGVLSATSGVTFKGINIDNGLPHKDSLMAYDGIVLDASLPADNAELVSFLKENIYWQPVFNVNGKLAEALGFGTVVEAESPIAWVLEPTNSIFTDFGAYYGDSVKCILSEVTSSPMVVTGQKDVKKYVCLGEVDGYTAYADSLLAYVYNTGHNQYAYYGVGESFAAGTEMLVQSIFAQTLASKRDVTATAKPSFKAEYKEMETTVSISGAKNAQFYYTTDGSEPTLSSTLYTEPVVFTQEATLIAVAIADGYTISKADTFKVELFHQAKAPVIACAGGGLNENAVVSISAESDLVDIYYNFTGSDKIAESSKYDGPITLPVSTTITVFAISDTLGLIQSELVSQQIFANVDKIRRDELAHFKVTGAEWNTLANLTLDGEPYTAWVNSNYYFSWGKSAAKSYEEGDVMTDESGSPIYGDDGNPVYETTPRPYSVVRNVNDPDWQLMSRGQVMIWQKTSLGGAIGDGSGYNPDRAEDYIENLGTTQCIQFGGAASGDQYTGAIQSTKKFAGPFNVVAIIANVGSGGRLAVEVSADSATWIQVGDTLQTSTVKRLYKKFEVSYEGTDEVYVRLASIKGSSQAVHDIYVFNHGEKSAAMKEELAAGIEEVVVAPETVVAVRPVKKVVDGKLVIVVGDAVYSVTGARLK